MGRSIVENIHHHQGNWMGKLMPESTLDVLVNWDSEGRFSHQKEMEYGPSMHLDNMERKKIRDSLKV